MKAPTLQPLIASIFLLCGGHAALHAGEVVSTTSGKESKEKIVTAPASSPLLCFADGKICFDLEERLRFEARENNFDFNNRANAQTDDNWLLQRFRLGITLKPTDWLKIYAQGQDSREFGSDRPNFAGVQASEGDNSFDLRQAYVTLGNPKLFPLTATIGRQLLAYGDERLVGSFDWNNFSRSFDAVKLRFEQPKWWLEAFSSSPVVITRGSFDQSDVFNGTELDRQLIFSGLYFSTTAIPAHTLDLYAFLLDERRGNYASQEGLLGLDNPGASPAQGGNFERRTDFVTLGFRLKNDPKKMHGFEYDAEAAGQAGKVEGLDLRAGAVHAGLGYNFLNTWGKPRLYAEYNFATGDGDRTDREDNTFQNLFPTNHKFYGYADFFAWENLHNPAVSLQVQPLEKLTVKIDGHMFFAATNEDSWYRANGFNRVRTIAPEAGKYEGTELDLTVTYKPLKSLAVQVGYSHFWTGDYLKATGRNDEADFGYVMTTLTF